MHANCARSPVLTVRASRCACAPGALSLRCRACSESPAGMGQGRISRWFMCACALGALL